MNTCEAVQVLRKLKGLPLTILLTMKCTGETYSAYELGIILDVGEKTVRKHLRGLEESGCVVRNGRYAGWDIAADSALLAQLMTLWASGKSSRSNGKNYRSEDESSGKSSRSSGKNYRSEDSASGKNSRSNGKNYRSPKGKNGVKPEGSGKNYRSAPSFSSFSSPSSRTLEEEERRIFKPRAREGELLDAFRDSGVGMNMWSELSGYSWVTADYVRGHCAAVRANGEPMGYAIQRMRCREPVPGAAEGCAEHGKRDCLICSGVISR